jgi:hypothetical protein
MGKLCEGLARLSGWTAGACLVLALLCVSGDVRGYEGGEDEECPACEELPPHPTPEQIAAYEACIAECLRTNCSGDPCNEGCESKDPEVGTGCAYGACSKSVSPPLTCNSCTCASVTINMVLVCRCRHYNP